MNETGKAKITAGLRGAGWNPARMDRPYRTAPASLRTADDQRTLGLLYTQTGHEKTVVCLMHPREFTGTPYLVPDILDAGCAAWVQAPRSIGSDLRLEHELALLDVAAGLTHLRSLGFTRTVLLGNSGGAGLFAFYTQQALRAPAERLARTPGGRPVALAAADLPVPSDLVFVSPHPGQGKLLMNGIDPSVTDENDALSTDPALDPFDAANGFAAPPASSRYAPEFVARYRAAQRARIERLDARAREMLAERAAARRQVKEGNASAAVRRMAAHTQISQVWRTDADLRCWDLSLDPSDRELGTLWGRDPYASNLGSVGFARLVTPESWLSTWSGISSNASFEQCGAELSLPTLVIEYTGDQAAFPSDMAVIYDSIGTRAKRREQVRGNHHGQALAQGEESGQVLAGRLVQQWLHEPLRP
ncbi:MAG TPA: alpha/beta hydrolase [Ramlibacter sp.]|nr:alpha/beta hydrolase [Ramlibacter sp.]